jgi:hypothetical protein
MITKHSGSSPPQRLPMSPAKPWVDKPKYAYDDTGRCSSLDRKGSKNHETHDVVRISDTGERHNGKR